ncbi:hypothetical protein [Micromonospora sp. NPDC051296]|uniref:hypothetical protein n=1 Tax=Micromonospora sp. NPDC051296 TaxID=3155046 RepID=UPI003418D5B3
MPDRPASDPPERAIAPGDVFLLTRQASPQFVRPITIRVIRHRTDRITYHGWTWIECYQLDARGDAVDRRELYLMPAGLIRPPAAAPRAAGPRAAAITPTRPRPESAWSGERSAASGRRSSRAAGA